jgi:class 3 adenylate cyclase
VTVLFADVVHSMDIATSVGPERLREIMADLADRCAAAVQRYGGTVNQFTGDGIMAVFGAPAALEDHAFRACLAALGVQEKATRLAKEVQDRDDVDLQLRVGLDSGQVIAGEIGSGAYGYTAIGEHVGIAQRMESVAPPGGVMLSASTARLVDGTAALGEPELVHIKGFDEPVRAHRLLTLATQPGSIGASSTKLVGRQWELQTVAAILDRSMASHGCVVGLAGPAGIGKSRLVHETAAMARRLGVEVFSTFCESHASDVSFHVAARLLRDAAGITDLDGAAAQAHVRAQVADASDEDAQLLYDLLGIRDPDAAVPTIDPDARRRRLTALINSMSLARTEPAIYVIEDAHWVDQVSESMLADFLTVIPQTHSVVLITYRPEYRGALAQVPGAQTISLAPLSDSEATALLDELLGFDPSMAAVKALIAGRVAGNPFFAHEIVRELAERGVLEGERGAYVCGASVADVSVPATLQAAIAARIDRLDTDAKQTLNAAAVVGLRFTVELLSALGTDPVLDELVRAELIDQVRFTPSAEYAFHHPLIRTVAYESQLKSERAELHRQLAAAIESRGAVVDENAALIAEHLEAAGDLRAAYGWHMRAGAWSQGREIAAALVNWDRAARVADQLGADDPDRLAMRIAPRTLSCAHGWRIHKPIAGKPFDELRNLCAAAGDKTSVAIAMAGLLEEHLMNGRLADASRLVNEHMVLIESIGDATLTVGLANFPAAVKMMSGEVAEALRLSNMVIDLAEGDRARGRYILGSPLATAYALRGTARWVLGRAGWREDFNRAVAMARDADPITQASVIAYTYSSAIGNGVIVADDAVLHDIDKALQRAEHSADDFALGFALFTKAVALLQLDSTQREHGLELCRQLREMAVGGRYFPLLVPVIDAFFAEEMIRRGDRAAVPLLRASIDALYSSELLAYWVWGITFLVEALLEGGTDSEIQEAEAAVERLSTLPVLDGWAYCDLILLRLRALLARARGEEVAYRDFADRYRGMATSLGFEGHIKAAEAMP